MKKIPKQLSNLLFKVNLPINKTKQAQKKLREKN